MPLNFYLPMQNYSYLSQLLKMLASKVFSNVWLSVRRFSENSDHFSTDSTVSSFKPTVYCYHCTTA